MRLLTIALVTLTMFCGCRDRVRPEIPLKRQFKVVTIVNGQTNVVYLTAKRARQAGRWFLN